MLCPVCAEAITRLANVVGHKALRQSALMNPPKRALPRPYLANLDWDNLKVLCEVRTEPPAWVPYFRQAAN